MSLSQFAFTSNIHFLESRLTVEGFLEDFIKKGDSQLTEATPFYFDEL